MNAIQLAHFLSTVTKKKGPPTRNHLFVITDEYEYYSRFDVWIPPKIYPELCRHINKYNRGSTTVLHHRDLPHMDDDEFLLQEDRWVSKVDEPILWEKLHCKRTQHPMKIPHMDGNLFFGKMCSSGPCDIYWRYPGWHTSNFESEMSPILSSDGESHDFEWNSTLRRWITRTIWGTIVPQQCDGWNQINSGAGYCLSHVDPSKFPSMSEAKKLLEYRKRIRSNNL